MKQHIELPTTPGLVFYNTKLYLMRVSTNLKFALLFLMTLYSMKAFSQTDSLLISNIVADGAKPQLISKQFKFTEGPAVDKKGNVFFTDQPNNTIWKYDTGGKLTLFLENAGRANGMCFDKKGNLVAAADEKNQLLSISPKGKVTVLVENLDGKLFNGPNDVWIDPKSEAIYFTDPFYARDYWTRKKPEIEGQKVYYLAKGTKVPVAVVSNLKQPNGIIGSPDGKYLYVADIGDNKTFKYTIAADGTLTDPQLIINQGSDGMTVDAAGNIYLTGRGVTVYDPTGKKIGNIPIPEGWTSNVAFAGKKRDKLFITASPSVYILDMKVRGAHSN